MDAGVWEVEAVGRGVVATSGDEASPSLGDGRESMDGLTKAELLGDIGDEDVDCTWKGEAGLCGNKEERNLRKGERLGSSFKYLRGR